MSYVHWRNEQQLHNSGFKCRPRNAGKYRQYDRQLPTCGKTECQTCKARKYQDGSNESDVSFKTAGHIDPEQSYAKVSAHEREHVANAIQKGSQPNAKLISANVTLKMAVCPECGRTYVAGGLTTTQIEYTEENPYEKNRKAYEGMGVKGSNVDLSA